MNKLFLLLIFAVCALLLVFLIMSFKKKSKILTAMCTLLAITATALSVCSLADVGTGGNDDMITSYVTVGKYTATEIKKSTRSTKSSKTSSETTVTNSQIQQTVKNDIANRETVYITKNGKKYHYSYTCGKGTFYECPYKEALEKGYEPCKRCVKS